MKIVYDFHTNSIGDMDERHVPASMQAIEDAIRAAYPDAEIEITLDAGRIEPVDIILDDEEEDAFANRLLDIQADVRDIANRNWANV